MDNEAPLPEPSPEPVPEAPAEIAEAPALAGFWVRGGAYLIDSLIISLCALIPMKGLGILVGLAYKTIFIHQGGQTPGKMAAGIKVVAVSGEPIGVGRALGRAACEWVSAMALCLGYLVAAFSDKRALHDYAAGTRVVYVDGVGRGRKALFAFIGALAVILPIVAIASFVSFSGLGGRLGALKQKSEEGATKGSLGMLRANASIYYGDMEGVYPASLDGLVSPKYLKEIPKAQTAGHPETAAWTAYGAEVCTGKTDYGMTIDGSKLKDTGGWGYVVDPKAPCWGEIFVDCTHKDSKGKAWVEY